MGDVIIPLPPQVCKECRSVYFNPRSQFCSIKCRMESIAAADSRNRPARAICATEGCENHVRTSRAMYCKECYPKARPKRPVPAVTKSDQTVQCYWCEKEVKEWKTVVNHMNEDYSDNSPGNRVVCCIDCNRGKRKALFFLDRISTAKFNEFGQMAIAYRNRNNPNR